jgi:hypothetical protein
MDKFTKIEKLIINANYPNSGYFDLLTLKIEHRSGEVHYILETSEGIKLRIIGRDEWRNFLDFVKWFDWDFQDTREMEIFNNDANIPFAEEIIDDSEAETQTQITIPNTLLDF